MIVSGPHKGILYTSHGLKRENLKVYNSLSLKKYYYATFLIHLSNRQYIKRKENEE